MKLTIEGEPKEIAALVCAVQERREEETPIELRVKVSDGHTNNLVVEQKDISNIDWCSIFEKLGTRFDRASTEVKEMVCPTCKATVTEHANFCPKCRAKLKAVCDCEFLGRPYTCGLDECPGLYIHVLEALRKRDWKRIKEVAPERETIVAEILREIKFGQQAEKE